MDQLNLFAEEPPASPSASPDSAAEWMTTVATFRSNFAALWIDCVRHGLFGKTYPESCRQMEDGTLVPSSGHWMKSGTVWRGESWTHNTSEWNHTLVPSRSDGGVCSLSDILETGDHLSRFSLSPRACAGILRRAAKRGKDLPEQLERALRGVADSEPISK